MRELPIAAAGFQPGEFPFLAKVVSALSVLRQCAKCEENSYTMHDPGHVFFKLPRPVQRPLVSPFAFLPRLWVIPSSPPCSS